MKKLFIGLIFLSSLTAFSQDIELIGGTNKNDFFDFQQNEGHFSSSYNSDYGYAIPDYLHEIRRERTVELYGEGFRFDDLMRWRAHEYFVGKRFTGTYYTDELRAIDPNMPVNAEGYLDPLMNVLTGPNNGYGFNPERDYLRPLPINELTLNENLTQNPGW